MAELEDDEGIFGLGECDGFLWVWVSAGGFKDFFASGVS